MPKKNKSKNNNVSVLVGIVLFLLGLGLFFYPQISDTYVAYRMRQEQYQFERERKQLLELEQKIRERDGKFEQQQQLELQREWQKLLATNSDQRSGNVYEIGEQMLTLGNVIIPAIGVNLSIHYGSSDEVLNNGAGLFENSSSLSGGLGQHIVITAHSGLPRARYFTDLEKLAIGDLVLVENFKEILAYRIKNFETVLPAEVESLKPIVGKDLITLITCTPIGINTHRLLVHGERVDYSPEIASIYEQVKKETDDKQLLIEKAVYIFTYFSWLVIIPILFWILKRRRKSKQK